MTPELRARIYAREAYKAAITAYTLDQTSDSDESPVVIADDAASDAAENVYRRAGGAVMDRMAMQTAIEAATYEANCDPLVRAITDWPHCYGNDVRRFEQAARAHQIYRGPLANERDGC